MYFQLVEPGEGKMELEMNEKKVNRKLNLGNNKEEPNTIWIKDIVGCSVDLDSTDRGKAQIKTEFKLLVNKKYNCES